MTSSIGGIPAKKTLKVNRKSLAAAFLTESHTCPILNFSTPDPIFPALKVECVQKTPLVSSNGALLQNISLFFLLLTISLFYECNF